MIEGQGGGSGALAGAGGAGGAGGAMGGRGGAGGAGGSGGTGGAGGTSANACGVTGPALIDPATLTSCESDTCSNAHCVPSGLLKAEQAAQLGDCDASNKCVPDELIETSGNILLATCVSLGGAEGRCVSTCVPRVSDRLEMLPQDTCEDDERCAPCFDPITGEDSGACHQGCDPGPTEEPFVFAECCGGAAACVPEALVPEAQRAMVERESCEEGEMCAPKDIVAGTYEPEACTSWGTSEGRCLLTCLPDVTARAAQLDRDLCDEDSLCVPCFDPLTGDSTGACELEGDMPDEPASTFPGCCDNGMGTSLGTCVPGALVPEEQQSMLGADTCTGDGFVCAPTEVAAGSYTPQSCDSWLNAEGRCLPACLPPLAAKADALERDVCDAGELCAPCYDPTTGDDSGSCSIDGDAPTEAPVAFPECCSTNGVMRGLCVPKPAAGESADSLPVLDCEDLTDDADSYVCAPKEKVADPDFQFPSCTTVCTGSTLVCAFGGIGGKPGACVPSCILSEQDTGFGTADELYGRSTCATGEDCAPCTDPQEDTPTGLCN